MIFLVVAKDENAKLPTGIPRFNVFTVFQKNSNIRNFLIAKLLRECNNLPLVAILYEDYVQYSGIKLY